MDIRKIRKLIELIEETGVFEIEIKEGEESVRLSRQGHPSYHEPAPRTLPSSTVNPHPANPLHHPVEEQAVQSQQVQGHKIRCPMVGTMYTSPSPESPPFVSLGQTIKVGDVLCIVEAMKMFNEIEADRSGKIVEILVNNGEPVEYDQPLFILEDLK